MIETIQYDYDYSAVVFDEPIEDYYNIMLDAASNNEHRRSKSYNRNILKESLFCVIFYKGNIPFNIFGVRQEPWMGNASQAFYREWKTTFAQQVDDKNLRNESIARDWYITRRIFAFFEEHPQFHQKYNIENLFLTRTYYENRKQSEKAFEKTLRRFSNSFDYKGVYLYKNVLQSFYVLGDDSFLKELTKYK